MDQQNVKVSLSNGRYEQLIAKKEETVLCCAVPGSFLCFIYGGQKGQSKPVYHRQDWPRFLFTHSSPMIRLLIKLLLNF